MFTQIPRGFIYWKSFETLEEAIEYMKTQKELTGSWREYHFNLTANEEGKFEVYAK